MWGIHNGKYPLGDYSHREDFKLKPKKKKWKIIVNNSVILPTYRGRKDVLRL